MPTKTYRCENCQFVFDYIQRFDEPNPTVCPNCDEENQLVRVYKPVGVVFKGSGFYATDNKNASRVKSPNGKPTEADAGSTKKETTGDKKASSTESSTVSEKATKTA